MNKKPKKYADCPQTVPAAAVKRGRVYKGMQVHTHASAPYTHKRAHAKPKRRIKVNSLNANITTTTSTTP